MRSGSTSCRERPASCRSTRPRISRDWRGVPAPGVARSSSRSPPTRLARPSNASSPSSTPTSSSSAAPNRSRRPVPWGAGPGRSSISRPKNPANPSGVAADLASRGRAFLDAGVERLFLDTAGGPHPGGTGTRAAERLAAAIARDVPVTLAGGLDPGNVAGALRAIPAVGVDVASGVERPRVAGQRPTKDPLRVALFVKRARASRDDRPNVAVRSDPRPCRSPRRRRRRPVGDGARFRWPLRAGDADGRARAARGRLRRSSERPGLLGRAARPAAHFAGRPTALYRADRLAEAVRHEAARLAGGGAARRRASRTSGSTSSARTSPTPGRTRSTTPSARRCSPGGSARPG